VPDEESGCFRSGNRRSSNEEDWEVTPTLVIPTTSVVPWNVEEDLLPEKSWVD